MELIPCPHLQAGTRAISEGGDSLQQLSPTAEQPAEALCSGTPQLNISLQVEPAALLEKTEGRWGLGPRCFTDLGAFLSLCLDSMVSHSIIIPGDVFWSGLLVPVQNCLCRGLCFEQGSVPLCCRDSREALDIQGEVS